MTVSVNSYSSPWEGGEGLMLVEALGNIKVFVQMTAILELGLHSKLGCL